MSSIGRRFPTANSPIQNDQRGRDVGEILSRMRSTVCAGKNVEEQDISVLGSIRISYRINHPWDLAIHVKWYQLTNLSDCLRWKATSRLGNGLGKEASTLRGMGGADGHCTRSPRNLINCQCIRYHDTASTIKWEAFIEVQYSWPRGLCTFLTELHSRSLTSVWMRQFINRYRTGGPVSCKQKLTYSVIISIGPCDFSTVMNL